MTWKIVLTRTALTLGLFNACQDAAGPEAIRNSHRIDAVTTNEAHVAANFTAEDLGVLPGGTASVGSGINANGDVAGSSETDVAGSIVTHPVLWTGTTPTDLGVPFGSSAEATDVNDARTVIGNSTGGFTTQGFLWSGGSFTLIPAPPPPVPTPPHVAPASINSGGEVVGSYVVNNSAAAHAFRYTIAGGFHDIHPAGYIASAASDVTDLGVVVGYAILPSGHTHAARWSANNVFTDLGVIAGTYAAANGANNTGAIVGVGTDSAGLLVPFLYRSGTGMIGAGVEGEANRISDRGRVVGTQGFSPPSQVTRGATKKGNAPPVLLPLLNPWKKSKAIAVNRCGDVAGFAAPLAGPTHAVRWRISACD